MSRDHFRQGASAALIVLILMTLAWELWLAPLRAGGSFLAFKALLLLLPLRGILAGRLYTYQWSSMFILGFFTEGVMRGWADHGLAQRLAWCEVLVSTLFFICVLGFARSFKQRA
ncbi:DUF2069 domain-containing protein [Chromobacterium amazonense]|uniref:DUF2069 domain-containing protein n=1 Tax=Chromobacterium amazonense TaxID=1382803 RepID=A0A1S1X831_9NEIS|nr:DUF2069 domain-containing protein [Chromobacterium amazonense]KIA82230.1 membrane protein [Chromobacterium piscinae]MBM2885484.1 DUF2069 domain-containing protein [Chromobacterium amazonense]MDE1714145.1 DUF2069 domain-containing protein [Chromobacterium amazonense]MDQ4539110.1 DUF2069 domain-containing protein [Chromobacterium amazonense]OHX15683.1 hypothetical protein BI343_17055 [Chromobacterium amazonense]